MEKEKKVEKGGEEGEGRDGEGGEEGEGVRQGGVQVHPAKPFCQYSCVHVQADADVDLL